MAFDVKGLALHSSSTGGGGFLSYSTADDPIATVKGNGYWSTTLSETKDQRARRSAESFIEHQRPAATRVSRSCSWQSDALEWDEAYLHTDGRIRMRGGDWNVS